MFSVAFREASAPVSLPPVVVDEEVEGESRPLPLSVSVASPALEVFRRELFDIVQSTFEVSASAGVVRTYVATLRGIGPKVTLKLGSHVLSMCAGAQFFAFFGAVFLLGPKSSSPASSQPGARWIYVKLVKAAAAYWRVVGGERAVFDGEWSPSGVLVFGRESRENVSNRQSKSRPYRSHMCASYVAGRKSAAPA